MRAPLYRLVEGPGWQDSLSAADPGDDRFADNVQALKFALEYAPWKYSQALAEEHDPVRIATTKDRAAGYRLVVGIRIDASTVTLGWVDVETLDD